MTALCCKLLQLRQTDGQCSIANNARTPILVNYIDYLKWSTPRRAPFVMSIRSFHSIHNVDRGVLQAMCMDGRNLWAKLGTVINSLSANHASENTIILRHFYLCYVLRLNANRRRPKFTPSLGLCNGVNRTRWKNYALRQCQFSCST